MPSSRSRCHSCPPIISRTITRKPTRHESHRGRTACLMHSRSPRSLQNISELLDCLCCIESCNDCENNTKNVLLRVLDSTTPHSFRNLNPPAFQLLRGASPFLAIDYVLTLHIPVSLTPRITAFLLHCLFNINQGDIPKTVSSSGPGGRTAANSLRTR